jgi:hypothetical protein
MYENRKYLIFPVSQLSQIDFDQVLETSAGISGLTSTEGPYTHSEILEILAGIAWTDPDQQV